MIIPLYRFLETAMVEQVNRRESLQKLQKLIENVRVAMLTTVASDGTLRSRPMATQDADVEFDGALWFYTEAASDKVREIQAHPEVNLSYSDGKSTYVSVSGSAELVRDRHQLEGLWNPGIAAWFPKGLDDPDIALLRVAVEKAEYWDTPTSKIVQTLAFTKAVLTGQRFEGGEHGKVSLAGQGEGEGILPENTGASSER
jgi:general stress protein 26